MTDQPTTSKAHAAAAYQRTPKPFDVDLSGDYEAMLDALADYIETNHAEPAVEVLGCGHPLVFWRLHHVPATIRADVRGAEVIPLKMSIRATPRDDLDALVTLDVAASDITRGVAVLVIEEP